MTLNLLDVRVLSRLLESSPAQPNPVQGQGRADSNDRRFAQPSRQGRSGRDDRLLKGVRDTICGLGFELAGDSLLWPWNQGLYESRSPSQRVLRIRRIPPGCPGRERAASSTKAEYNPGFLTG